MTDQELLELAAKAAGIYGDYSPKADAIVTSDKYWMPHKDDVDALKLVVDLNLEVERNRYGNKFYVGPYGKVKLMEDSDDHWIDVDDALGARKRAFRYAILSAAAEIGKSMEKSQ